ncbi:transcriptional regulator [Oscillatoria sp. FACHB-1406]|uniref:helix-turn-helix domain-containing protein n=1 Tax=Oscillatoria sp. FACHB-1406 TaxID=2692846 RepID=UPI001682EEBE|nr:transcriptional regulator [Oscillatoria sp. FACHB-1406]MBD2580402.1 transcriptional regulator [Oscillatoria sp. FACHB-1406]
MTLTFDRNTYINLLVEVVPQPIQTEVEYQRALTLVEALMHKADVTPEEERVLDLFVILIEKFESEQYPLQNLSTPRSRLLHLMESNNLRETDLLGIFGSSGIISEVIHGKREIGKTHAQKLGDYFKVSPALFLI